MKRSIVIVALIALAIVNSVLALKLIQRRHASLQAASQSSVAARPNQTSQMPVQQQPLHPGGVMIVGNGSNLTVIRPVSVDQDDYSYLHISLTGDGEMLFKDGESRVVGFESASGKLLTQIANSSYDEGDQIDDDDEDPAPGAAAAPSPTPEPTAASGLLDNGFRRLEVGRPAPGTYLLTVTTDSRSGNSKYSLAITFTSRSDKMSLTEFKDVAAAAGSGHIYKLQIPSDPLGEIKAELVSPAR
jgi:hypothetical protein